LPFSIATINDRKFSITQVGNQKVVTTFFKQCPKNLSNDQNVFQSLDQCPLLVKQLNFFEAAPQKTFGLPKKIQTNQKHSVVDCGD
jgi:hypothetical protein